MAEKSRYKSKIFNFDFELGTMRASESYASRLAAVQDGCIHAASQPACASQKISNELRAPLLTPIIWSAYGIIFSRRSHVSRWSPEVNKQTNIIYEWMQFREIRLWAPTYFTSENGICMSEQNRECVLACKREMMSPNDLLHDWMLNA